MSDRVCREKMEKKNSKFDQSPSLLLLYPSQKPNVRSRKCRSRVEAADKSRIQSFEFIRSIIFCRKLFLKRESYFSSAAYDLLSVFLGYYSVFSTNHTKARPKENSVYPFSLLVSFSKFFPFGERISSISRWGREGKNK